jgi:hypothetical protein
VIARPLNKAQQKEARAVAEHSSERLRAGLGIPGCTSEWQLKWRDPRRVASVDSDNVFVVENLLTKEHKAAYATFLRLY